MPSVVVSACLMNAEYEAVEDYRWNNRMSRSEFVRQAVLPLARAVVHQVAGITRADLAPRTGRPSRIHTSMSESDYEVLAEAAEKLDTSVSRFMATAIRIKLAQLGELEPARE